ncbi:MAG: SRPBCC domain-containing protein [Acidimicrobiia bacterium]|nr:SRPBCC domain-containing protein [Acidimicrobiia bacterium]
MPVGKTRDVGWQIGVSITVPRPAPVVWDWLVSQEGLATWLGDGVELTGTRGEPYETADGTHGELRSFRPRNRVRLTWQPRDWAHDSTVQVAVDDKVDRTRIVFHQERLADADERARQRDHWKTVSETVRRALSQDDR